jgi:tRNA(fMet)-specific endonuclease VapC
MAVNYLLDTNVLSEAVKTDPDRNVMAMLKRHQDEIATAAPVWHELIFGCLRLPTSPKREMIKAYLEDVLLPSMDILPYNERAAEWHAEQRAKLSMQGKMPSFVDGQIAAIAWVNRMILVTRNTSDFESFENLKVLNWHKGG